MKGMEIILKYFVIALLIAGVLFAVHLSRPVKRDNGISIKGNTIIGEIAPLDLTEGDISIKGNTIQHLK